MKAHVVIEVEADAFDNTLPRNVIDASITEVEIRQADGLLTERRRVLLVEGLGSFLRKGAVVDEGLPAARFYIAPRGEKEAGEA